WEGEGGDDEGRPAGSLAMGGGPYRRAQCRSGARRPDRSQQDAQCKLAADPEWPKSVDQSLAAHGNGRSGKRKSALKRRNQEHDADDQHQGGDAQAERSRINADVEGERGEEDSDTNE